MFPIGAVERDTGIARDTLRIWERRYGFPVPERNVKGERIYSENQVRILQLIKRLLDQGVRPGKVVGLEEAELNTIAQTFVKEPDKPSEMNPQLQKLVACVASHDSNQLWLLLEEALIRQGLKAFIMETVAPLIYHVGEKWAIGDINVFEEHFVTRQLTLFLDSIISKIPVKSAQPPVLLATLPGESHSLGLIMLESLLRDQGIKVVNLGTEVPMDQLIMACQRYQVGAILLSFSGAYNSNAIRKELIDLAERLSDEIPIYVGGSGVKRMRKLPPQVKIKNDLSEITEINFQR